MNDIPDPPLPPDADLRDFVFMPLDVLRLRDSGLAVHASGDGFRAAVLLWCASWHQLPSGSLPDDDAILAQLAGYGRVVKEWKKVRDEAMRGWYKCSDGLLYHPVVAEKAAESWAQKLDHRAKREAERKRKAEVRERIRLEEEAKLRAGQSGGCPQDSGSLSAGQSENNQRTTIENPPENALKGQGEGQGEVRERDLKPVTAGKPTAPPAPPDPSHEPPAAPPEETSLQLACKATWHAYQAAYAERYAVPPVRNAKVNALIKQFVQLLGAEDAPRVAAFYVGHSNAFYVKKGHDLGSLVVDAGKLRTEWVTGRMVTATSAQQVDRTQSNCNAANEAKRILASNGASV